MADEKGFTGFNEAEAKEFHNLYMMSFYVFVAIAVVAHLMVWMWRPWFVPAATAQLLETAQTVTSMLS